MKNHIDNIQKLLAQNNFATPSDIRELPSSGSDRLYFRVTFNTGDISSLLAAFNPDVNENIAWFAFSIHFKSKGLNVPEIYAKDEDYQYFLMQDLGDLTLFEVLQSGNDEARKKYVRQALQQLIRFQVEGIEGLDLDVAYPAKTFNRRSILWDLNYFKYYFLKPNKISFDENKLEVEFETFAGRLLEPEQRFFLYRDFQSRNIMIQDEQLWYIDFQGGRRGPLQYDVASFLYQARAGFDDDFRNEMYLHYLSELQEWLPDKQPEFEKYFSLFVYFRLMQVLGAYGFRGIIQRKGHFLQSIPFAINQLEGLLKRDPLPEQFPALHHIFSSISGLKQHFPKAEATEKLTIQINSFSYLKTGYPADYSVNGGGFVFDCRALPNPGRIPELRNFTGLEKPIRDFLKEQPEIGDFLEYTFSLVDRSIENYLARGFNYLTVNYGCTGGKHRSVYAADQLKKHLAKYGNRLDIIIKHLQIDG